MTDRYRVDELPCDATGVQYIVTDTHTGLPDPGRYMDRKGAEEFAAYLNDPRTIVNLNPQGQK